MCIVLRAVRGWTASFAVGPGRHPTRPLKASATSSESVMSSPSSPMVLMLTQTEMRLPHEAPWPDAPGVLRGGGGCQAHKHVGVMAVVLHTAQAGLTGGRVGGRWPSTALDEVLSCTGLVDDRCVAKLPTWCTGGATRPQPRQTWRTLDGG